MKKKLFSGITIVLAIAIVNYLGFFDFSKMVNNKNMIKEKDIQKVISGKAVLAVKIYPKENAETVVLLHGGPGVPDKMLKVVEILKEKYQVINFEQRGVGDSICTGCRYSMEEYISDIDAIGKHFNLKSFHLFGHSWGGLYAQIYAEQRPGQIKSLFLISPGSGTNIDWEKTKKEVMAYNKKNASNLTWIKMGIGSLFGMLGSDTAYRKLYKQVVENYNRGYGGGSLPDEILGKINAEPANKTVKEISEYPALKKMVNPGFPIIITYGDNDIYGESKKSVYDRFPTAKFFIIKNSGHFPWSHNPGDFTRILKNFYGVT